MPKVVNHEKRRSEIVDALSRIILRDGLAAASVRTVAVESGWSAGAIRHYFGTQSELIAVAAETIIERTTERVAALAAQIETLDDLIGILEECLPLDAQRRADSEVWLALVSRSQTDESLRPLTEEAHRRLRKMCSDIVGLIADERPGPGIDRRRESDRLHALLDGLALHGTLYPRQMPATRMRAAVRAHVEALATASRQPR